MKLEAATKLAEQGLDQLARALDQGHSDTFVTYLSVLAKFHRYSFQNCMMIACQCSHATHVVGFNAWKKLRRNVKKGEKRIAILAPCVYLTKSEDDENNGQKTVRETEAEAVAFVVCQACGLDSGTRSADDIQLYRGTSDTLAESLDYIQQTAAHIIVLLEVDSTVSLSR